MTIKMQPSSKNSGFTLLEVMIALTILVIAFGAILQSQSGSITQVTKAKDLNLGRTLAKNLLLESEKTLEGRSFSEIPKESEGSFEAPYERFTWKREVKPVEFPNILENYNKKSDDSSSPNSDSATLMTKAVTKFFNDSLREMIVTVKWTKGKGEQSVSFSTFMVNLNATFNFSF
jgi:prepilin-type N-terminal cleavage/methylation domain-containing protein